jgi:hypothetical protein
MLILGSTFKFIIIFLRYTIILGTPEWRSSFTDFFFVLLIDLFIFDSQVLHRLLISGFVLEGSSRPIMAEFVNQGDQPLMSDRYLHDTYMMINMHK